jgi:hypothetical protein
MNMMGVQLELNILANLPFYGTIPSFASFLIGKNWKNIGHLDEFLQFKTCLQAMNFIKLFENHQAV